MKKIMFCLIILLIIFSGLFPPWQRTYRDGNTKHSQLFGYSWFFSPPSTGYAEANAIDFSRLFVQIGLLSFIGTCLLFFHKLFSARTKHPKKHKSIQRRQ